MWPIATGVLLAALVLLWWVIPAARQRRLRGPVLALCLALIVLGLALMIQSLQA